MKYDEHLLTILAEECAEVHQRVSKALRFGLNEIQPGQPYTNAQRVMHEFRDLSVILGMCNERGLLPAPDLIGVKEKIEKIEKYITYARERGMIQS